MGPQSERFEMRLDPDILSRIDTWRGKQDDIPSRAEAIRRLVEASLVNISMKDSEKLIISLLCDLHKAMKISDRIDGLDPNFIRSAIRDGHQWAIKWQYPGLLQNRYDAEETVKEVCDILEMWYRIESAYERLSANDKEYIKTNSDFGEDVKFEGFDGNNEIEHYSITRFLIDEMGRFSEFKGRADLNSHCQMVPVYQRMLEVFRPIWKKLLGRELNAKDIVEILNARVHPTMRHQ